MHKSHASFLNLREKFYNFFQNFINNFETQPFFLIFFSMSILKKTVKKFWQVSEVSKHCKKFERIAFGSQRFRPEKKPKIYGSFLHFFCKLRNLITFDLQFSLYEIICVFQRSLQNIQA